MNLTFRSAKLLDHLPTIAELEVSRNPIAAIVVAQLRAIQTRRNPVARRQEKFRLVKMLLQRNLSKDDVRQLFRLIDWLMTLPDALEDAFLTEVHQFEQENKMEYLSSIERRGYKKGMEQGEQKGERKGLLRAIDLHLSSRFGIVKPGLLKKIHAIQELDQLSAFAEFLYEAHSLDDVRNYLK